MRNNIVEFRLLPNYFKKIAFVTMAMLIVFVIFSALKNHPFGKDLLRTLVTNIFLLSLLLLALSKDIIEDELTLRLRSQAFAMSFIFGVGFIILQPFTNLLFDGEFLTDDSSAEILILMLFVYFGFFRILKKKR